MQKDNIDDLKDDWGRQRPELNAEPMGIVLRIQSLAKVLGMQTSAKLEGFNLQWWQYDVLSALRRQGSPYVLAASELAQEAMLTSGAMTNRIDRLEVAGLIQRLRDKSDGRKVLVRLTVRGRKLIDSATEARFEVATQALHGLSLEQRQQLSNLLRELLRAQTE